ncbi:exodeoxyribonuclease III [Gynurincola endophyticus]|uniref:exodeoxyribonuclease III n=1 Tax=Gynurincola endophyticus TaxID=2479004 RepID=UPI000F8EA649|nr:exodeoxyribonuclease III [Gynurincola endophyticus]
MRIVSYNVNGVRAAMKKGLIDWLKTDPADIICLQETKAHRDNVDYQQFIDLGYTDYWYSAKKKGYSGVAVFSKLPIDEVFYGTGHSISDEEGRVITVRIKDTLIINAYFPSGTSGDERQSYKYVWLEEMYAYLEELKTRFPKIILCGDYNIAHREIDIHDPKGNKKSSGFLPEERAWMDKFLENGWVDTFRHLHDTPHSYTWWSQRFPSVRLNNKGWRIDYISVTEALKSSIKGAAIYPDVKQSDHCPIYLELK